MSKRTYYAPIAFIVFGTLGLCCLILVAVVRC